jgi:hypothetical protein
MPGRRGLESRTLLLMQQLSIVTSSLLAVIALSAACMDAPDDTVPDEIASAAEGLNLVALVPTATGGTVEFYEPEPGRLLISGSERAGVTSDASRLDFATLSPDEIYAALAPDRTAPLALVEAYARAATIGPTERAAAAELQPARDHDGASASDLVAAVGSNAIDDSECRAAWFEENYCGQWCWLHRTDDTDQVESDVTWVQGAACAYRGSIQFAAKYRPWYTWQSGGSWTVLEGKARWWNRFDATDYDFKTVVREADGDGYHHGGWWRK